MVRKDTNRHYSLRKLKKGTASVAVALTVVGAGFANQTEVKAEEHPGVVAARESVLNNDNARVPGILWLRQKEENDKLKLEKEGLETELQEKEQEVKNLKDNVEKLKDAAELERLKNERHDHDELERLKNERHDHDKKEAERKALEDKLADKQEHLNGALRYINEKEAERKEKEAEQKK
ncbi:TPA: YSIRK-type signal peptide-containing protein, partial [Streptococcus pyogenes]|nr:YSIRK-type signal peptide-containing protein [Streptococcus pyogenes]HES1752630.1 YSIRK-type signal peptide-containing protein [Streptococcus pyogenes]HES4677420.1 YSIRK-type signal peptide-containing protein [Streptococcus pyogenes]HES4685829.1 YSIRK-type signal peptide-containing protein [Streptococcus pyogenes]HES5472123.1 YSIRK-type signal peptide-containing protein [Streptococcus pyogenes]